MKTLFLWVVLCLSGILAQGQKIDLDKYYFSASYRDLPRTPVDTSFHTYYVQVEISSMIKKAMKDQKLEEIIDIEGWRKLTSNAHMKIGVKMEDIIVDKPEVKERVEVLKDKSGKVIGKKSYYYIQLTYSFAAEAKIEDYKGRFITSWLPAQRNAKQTHRSVEFPSYDEAYYFFKYSTQFMDDLIRQAVLRTMQNLNGTLTYNFGFPHRNVNDYLWILDSKKHPEYDAYRKAWQIFKKAMFQMSADEPLDRVKEMVQPVIAYLQNIKKKYPTESKTDRKIRYSSFYNLAKIYYYLDNPDAAMEQATMLRVNKYDEKDGRQMAAAAADLKMMFKQNKMNSRHFRVYPEQYRGPEVASSQ
jgi:hypothetical protein